jgi:predicted ATP-grasp superfamily ATP-dependent carboligase
VGASGRAAAASALRAGFDPFVLDLFADADTKRLCPVLRCPFDQYPHGFLELANRAPPSPWMYTGGLENHPDVVAAISETRPLWGNGPDKLTLVRDPFVVRQSYRAVAYSIPDVLPGVEPPPPDRTWLRKPIRSGGGGGITRHDPNRPAPSAYHVFQEFVPGEPISLLFLSEDRRLSRSTRKNRMWPYTVELGIFRQLIGTPWLHAREFQYAGNLGPFPPGHFGLPGHGAGVLEQMNDVRAELAGVWGADFILTTDRAHLIEINPRYTASVELMAYAGWEPLTKLADCVTKPDCLWKFKSFRSWPRIIGKAIYYAAAPIPFPVSGPWDDSLAHCTDVWRRPDYADIPEPGTVIEPGQPVLTLFAEATTEAECMEQLKRRAAGLDQHFGVRPPPEDKR